MPAAHQVVSVPAAIRPPILRGHHQPLVDAEHIPLCRPLHSADRQDPLRDQTSQHQPRAHSLHTHPCRRGSVMEEIKTARSGLIWSELACTETITKDLCNRLEAERREGWPAVLSQKRERCKGPDKPKKSTHSLASLCTAGPSPPSPNPNYLIFPTLRRVTSSCLDSDCRRWVFISL